MSLLLLSMTFVTPGCLVADPPEYGVARQTPPFLDLTQAKVFGVLDFNSNELQKVKVGVRSEDAGDELFAQLILDYSVGAPTGTEQFLGFARIPASTFDDTSRSIEVQFTVPNRPGCHQMSLVVTHSSNLGPTNNPILPSDVGIATWWVDIDDDDQDPHTVKSCPRQLGGTQ